MSLAVVLLLFAANPIDVCVDASDRAQQLRDERHWVLATRELLTCAQEMCPKPVRANCLKWRAELEQALPTLVIQPQLDGADSLDASVAIDGETVTLDGTARPVDPGSHTITGTLGDAHATLRILVLEGEKNRKVLVPLRREPATPVMQQPVSSPVLVRPAPVGPALLGGIALAGFATFAVLGANGRARLTSLENAPCAVTRTCDAQTVGAIRSQYLVADVTLGIASAVFTVAAVWFIAWLAG